MTALPPIAHVACGSCHACCKSLVILQPEAGDDVNAYETVDIQLGPNTWGKALRQHDDGSCVYLGPDGCTIHPLHPVVCRVFDCAGWFLSFTRTQRRHMLRTKQYNPEIYEAGKARAKDFKGVRLQGRR